MFNDFIEKVENHLKSTNSKYTIGSIEIVTTVINDIIDIKGEKVTIFDIIENSPEIILKLYGYLWNVFLETNHIKTWEDFGNVVFVCVDLKIFKKSEEDKLEDFIEEERVYPLFEFCRFLEQKKVITQHIK